MIWQNALQLYDFQAGFNPCQSYLQRTRRTLKSFLGVSFLGLYRYQKPLERAAYQCGSALVRRYHQRILGKTTAESVDPSLSWLLKKPRKRWVFGIGVLCSLVFGITQLPDWTASDLRAPLNRVERVPDQTPEPRPRVDMVWSMRGQLTRTDGNSVLERQGYTFVSGHISPLSDTWLVDLSDLDKSAENLAVALGPSEDNLSEFSLAALPDLDPGRLLPFAAAGAEALDMEGSPLRWNMDRLVCEVTPSAQSELLTRLDSWEREQDNYARKLQSRAERYSKAVETWSRRYDVNPELLYAIIYTESSFNPNLVSHRDAHGLMQVVPATAGGEVKAWLGEKGTPTSAELLDPATNIKYGAAYFRLLMKRHFPGVKDDLTREYLAIAAYNAGSGQVLRIFGSSRDKALDIINSMDAEEVLEVLMTRAPSRETRSFLKKVIASRNHFLAMS